MRPSIIIEIASEPNIDPTRYSNQLIDFLYESENFLSYVLLPMVTPRRRQIPQHNQYYAFTLRSGTCWMRFHTHRLIQKKADSISAPAVNTQ